MARRGLRAVEIARLRLEDVDWRSGEVVVRGKGGCLDRMPLPRDVGAALADHLRHGRRRSRLWEVFLRTIGPNALLDRHVAAAEICPTSWKTSSYAGPTALTPGRSDRPDITNHPR
jgi:integrase